METDLRSCPCILQADKKGDPRWKPAPTGNVFYMLNAEIPDTALILVIQRPDGS